MSTPTPDIARLDVPLERLDADLQFLRLKREDAAREQAGRLAEQRHQFLDRDADSTCPLDGASLYPYLRTGGQA